MKRHWMLAAASLALMTDAGAMAQSSRNSRVAALQAGEAAAITPAEREQGRQANQGIVGEYGGAYTGRQAAYVERIGRKVAVQSGLSSDPGAFDVTVLNSSVNNAFAIPGGYIYVTRQLLALMNDEAELAAVLGHEVAHVAARHSAQRQKVAQRNSIFGALGQAIAGAVAGDSVFGDVLGRAAGTGAQLLTLGYSRGQETESDTLGIGYLRRSGYDPEGMASMLDSLASQTALDQEITGDARSTPAWASTHPDPGARIDRAAREAGTAGGQRNRDSFLAAIDGMPYGDDPAQGVIEGRDFFYPPGRVAFTVPEGFTMQNGAKAVTIAGQGGQAQFGAGRYDGNIESYVRSVLSGLGGGAGASQAPIERTTIGGIPAAVTTARGTSGSTPIDATVVAYAPGGAQAYHFIVIGRGGQGTGALTPMVESFRRMTAADNALARPRFVRVVTVKAGDTAQSLSARMAYSDAKLDRFLVLNRLSADDPLPPKVKIVGY